MVRACVLLLLAAAAHTSIDSIDWMPACLSCMHGSEFN